MGKKVCYYEIFKIIFQEAVPFLRGSLLFKEFGDLYSNLLRNPFDIIFIKIQGGFFIHNFLNCCRLTFFSLTSIPLI